MPPVHSSIRRSDSQAGQIEEAREAFKAAVELLEASGHYQTKVVGTAMEWATWEINGGHLDKLEVPIETCSPTATMTLCPR